MATIYIDGRAYEVQDGQNLLQACLSLGLNLPYFCWHPALGSVGACRQCAVMQFKDENDRKGKMVMACMTPASNNTRISLEDPQAREFRAAVIEWLMVNHPHDCPVCDEGGECHLQDMTVMTGHNYRKYRFEKRTHRNQDLGPFITHEMNRCIACYRCVRYYRDYADGRDLDVFGAHDHVYFGRHADGVLENKFSGNLVEVCPTGVFTDKTLAMHYTRKWDLQTAPSVCVLCGVGCNTIPGERYGTVRRIRNRYHEEVNGYFLCDRGRFGYEFVNSDKRIREPLVRANRGETFKAVTPEEAIKHIVGKISDKNKVIGIGSPRASLESNFALRALVDPERFYQGCSSQQVEMVSLCLKLLREGPAKIASLKEIANSDAVLILGEDVLNYAPMMALALRQAAKRSPMKEAAKMKIAAWHAAAVQQITDGRKGPFFIASPGPTGLDDVATRICRLAPDDVARLGYAVAHALDEHSPVVPNMVPELGAIAGEIAEALKSVDQPVVVSGPSLGSHSVLHAANAVATALCKMGRPARLCFTTPECNSMGTALVGGEGLEAAFRDVEQGGVEAVIVLENDLFRGMQATQVQGFIGRVKQLIVIDHTRSQTVEAADVVLPAGTFAESSGTLVNYEGRAQRFFQVFVPAGYVQESWRWLGDLTREPWANLDGIMEAMGQAIPALGTVKDAAPDASFRIDGLKIARKPHRYSGRTAMEAHRNVHELLPPPDPDTPLAYTMEGFQGVPPNPAVIPRYWEPGWNSVQSLNKFQQEIGGSLRGGIPGRRLIEASGDSAADSADIPPGFTKREQEWLLVPVYHIFGTEPFSMVTPGVAALAPEPYLAMHPEDAARIRAGEGDVLRIQLSGETFKLPVKMEPGLVPGLAGLPAGLPGVPVVAVPSWAHIAKEVP